MKNGINKEENEDLDMSSIIVPAGIIAIIAFAFFLLPAVDVLTISITIPPIQDNVNLVSTKITLYQQYSSSNLQQNASSGSLFVNVTLYSSSGEQKFQRLYYLKEGKWIINTFEPISRGDNVKIEMDYYPYFFSKVIPVE